MSLTTGGVLPLSSTQEDDLIITGKSGGEGRGNQGGQHGESGWGGLNEASSDGQDDLKKNNRLLESAPLAYTSLSGKKKISVLGRKNWKINRLGRVVGNQRGKLGTDYQEILALIGCRGLN